MELIRRVAHAVILLMLLIQCAILLTLADHLKVDCVMLVHNLLLIDS